MLFQKDLSSVSFSRLRFENMKEQHKNVKSTRKRLKGKFVPAEPENDFGFVAVAAGNGLKDLF